jgi:hypothetical protein
MCPGCDIAVAVHEARAGHPPLVELVKDATRAASESSPALGPTTPGVPEPADEGPLYVARRKIIRNRSKVPIALSSGSCCS